MTLNRSLPENDECAKLLHNFFVSTLKNEIEEKLKINILKELDNITTGLHCIHGFLQYIKINCPPDKLASLNSILINYYEPILQKMRLAVEQSIAPIVRSQSFFYRSNTLCSDENKSSLPGFTLEISKLKEYVDLPAKYLPPKIMNHLKAYAALQEKNLCDKFISIKNESLWRVKDPDCLNKVIGILKASAIEEAPAVTLPENTFEMEISENKKCANLLLSLFIKTVEACNNKEEKFSIEATQDSELLPKDFLNFYNSVFPEVIDLTQKEVIKNAMRYFVARYMVLADIIITANTEVMNWPLPIRYYKDDESSIDTSLFFPAITINQPNNLRWLGNSQASIYAIIENLVRNNLINILPVTSGSINIYRVTTREQLKNLIDHLETQLVGLSSSADEKAMTSTQKSVSSLIPASVFKRTDTTPATTIASAESAQIEIVQPVTLTPQSQ